MSAEDITQLGTMLRFAKTNVVFAGTLKDLLENGYHNCSLYLQGIPNNSKYICHKFEFIPPKNEARLNRNVSEYLHRFIGLKPPLWISDLCAALITVSALFLIHLKCVLHLSALVHSVRSNQLAQVFHSEVTKLLAFLGDHFKIGKLSLTADFCLYVTRQNIKEEIMSTPNLPGPAAYDSNFEIDRILEDHDAFIIDLARKNLPRIVTSPEVLDLDIDELAQNSRIKLWIASQRKQITSLKAYIRCIVRTQSVNMVRGHQSVLPLPTDEEGELYQGNLLVTPSEGMRDPVEELEQEEMITDYIAKTVDEVLKLPPRQQLSMICSLKKELDDLLLLVNAFQDRGVDIGPVNCPEEREDLQRNRASLSVARKKLRALKKSKYVHE